MRASQYYKQFLSSKNVQDNEVLTITGIEKVTLRQGTRLALRFHERSELLPLNQTNAAFLVTKHGDETEKWIGQKVQLSIENVAFGDDTVEGVRLV